MVTFIIRLLSAVVKKNLSSVKSYGKGENSNDRVGVARTSRRTRLCARVGTPTRSRGRYILKSKNGPNDPTKRSAQWHTHAKSTIPFAIE
jgi:hypothetical protein